MKNNENGSDVSMLELWPSSPRDTLISVCSFKFGRLDNYAPIARLRGAMLSAIARENAAVQYDTSYGFRLLLHAWDAGTLAVASEGRIFDRPLTRVLSSVIQPGDTVVDGGANVGFYSLLAATRLKGNGIVFSFEPDPRNLVLLRANAALNGLSDLISVESTALGDMEGDLDFWYSRRTSWAGSLLETAQPQGVRVRVPATRLDVFRSSRNVGKIDVIKLDLEGGEPLALQGMSNSLRCAKLLTLEINIPRLLQMSTNPCRLIQTTLDQGEFTLMLLSDGHTLEVSTPGDARWNRVLDKLGWADAICAKGEAADRLRGFVARN